MKGTEPAFIGFSDEEGPGGSGFIDKNARIDLEKRVSGPRLFVESLRVEMRPWTDPLADLSTSWRGVICYVGNP